MAGNGNVKKLWNTKLINSYNEKYKSGIELESIGQSPYYKGQFGWRDTNVAFKLTKEEIDEIKKCKETPLYFIDKYGYAMTDDGIQKITLYDYQRRVIETCHNNRLVILLSSRQMGKSIIAAFIIAWYVTVHYDRNVLIVSNKAASANDVVVKIKHVLTHLPFFLKPGIVSYGVTGIVMDNGCRILASATTPTAGIGTTNHFVYADEFAYVHKNMAVPFYKSIFPTLVSSKISRMLITSTANGIDNNFYRIYDSALKEENDFTACRVDWWEHPERDEEWKEKEIANLGSIEVFNQEYGNSFQETANLLALSSILSFSNRIKTEYKQFDIPEIESDLYTCNDKLKWHPYYFKDFNDDDKFVVSVDLSSGLGGDYTVFNIFLVRNFNKTKILRYSGLAKEEDEYFSLIQVGLFRDNRTPLEDSAYMLADLVVDFLLPENTMVLVEINHRGEEFIKEVLHYCDDLNDYDIFFKDVDERKNTKSTRRLGVYVSKNKINECKRLQKDWLNKRIIPNEKTTINEMASFGLNNKQTSFEGLGNNDDIVMTMVNLTRVFGSKSFFDLIEDNLNDFTNEEYDIIESKLI